MFKWIKLIWGGKAGLVKELDELEKPLAGLIRKAQANAGNISPEGFSKELVDEIQLWLCKQWNIDPKDVGL